MKRFRQVVNINSTAKYNMQTKPRLCAIEHLPNEFTEGISGDPHNPDTLVQYY